MLTRLSLVIGLSVAVGFPLSSAAQPGPGTPKKDKQSEKRREKRRDMRKKQKDVRENHRDMRKKRQDVRENRRDKRDENKSDKREAVRDERRDKRESTRDLRKKNAELSKTLRDTRRKRVRRWRKRAVVSRYSQGPKRTVVRGENFPSTAVVTVDGKPIKATITPTAIRFDSIVGGTVAIKIGDASIVVGRSDRRKALTKAERKAKRKTIREARRKRARAAVKTRWKKRAKDRAKRRERLKERREQARATRAARAAKRSASLRASVDAKVLARNDVRTELALHAERMARLFRMRELAALDESDEKAVRVEVLIEQEGERHKGRMTLLATVEVTP